MYTLEQETLLDKAMIQYGNRLEQGPTDHAPTIEAPSMQAAAVSKPTFVKKGWDKQESKAPDGGTKRLSYGTVRSKSEKRQGINWIAYRYPEQ